jgi:hypothetical protein
MRSDRRVPLAGALAAVTLAACGGGEVTIQVLSEADGQAVPVSDLPVSFLPYDRDSVFEALAARAPEPEPEMDPELLAAAEEVTQLQMAWRTKEDAWANARDSLAQLSERLQNMDPRSRDYRQLYEQFDRLEQRVNRLDRENKEAFAAFDELQRSTLKKADSMRVVLQQWEDMAYADYFDVVGEIEESRGAATIEDTTDADGYVTQKLSGEPWYVTTRLPTQFGDLYWNVQIDPSGPDTLQLTPDLAERRMRP